MRFRWFVVGLLLVALLVPAVMITGARLLGPEDARLIRLVSFTPYATVLYAAALLLLLLALVVGKGFWRRAVGFLVVPVLLLGGVHAFWLSGAYVGQARAVAAGPTLTVMTSNLSFGGADGARVLEIATANDADILVLSEVTPGSLDELEAAGVHRRFPHSAGETAPLVSGTMVFAKGRLAGVTGLETTFRGYRMKLRTADVGTLTLFAVHPHPPVGDAVRWKQDHAVITEAVRSVPAGVPALVVGDLNATPDHAVLRRLGDQGFRTSTEVANSGFQPTWPGASGLSALGVAVPPVVQIDHVLTNDSLSAVTTETVAVEGTDHRAVVAELVLR